ncbi:hypothetical protein U1Q18_036518 [Sarracenia purpurea var. burkii]
MSSCLSGSRAYGFDLEIVKSLSSSTITSHSSSPSSTLSESSNSPLAISTRKPRTPRKRPNQTYNEAVALLSTAYPTVFPAKLSTAYPTVIPAKNLIKHCKFGKPHNDTYDSSSDLLLPFRVFDNSGFLLHQPIPEKQPGFRTETRVVNYQENPWRKSDFPVDSLEFLSSSIDVESMLDQEIEEGVDSIMGNLSVRNNNDSVQIGAWSDYPIGLGFEGKIESGMETRMGGVRALRQVEEGDWWMFPTVNVIDISPKLNKTPMEKSKKKKKKIENLKEIKGSEGVPNKGVDPIPKEEVEEENSIRKYNSRLLLKLSYEDVVNAWSGRGSPFSEEVQGREDESSGNDLHTRLAQIDLFPENGGVREASVLRYKEKRRTRLFSKKIRYQVRKVNADRRPRMKGRFVKSPNSL